MAVIVPEQRNSVRGCVRVSECACVHGCVRYGVCDMGCVGVSPDQVVICGDEHVELQQASGPALIMPFVPAGARDKGKGEEGEREGMRTKGGARERRK